jgi:hypothetical protein
VVLVVDPTKVELKEGRLVCSDLADRKARSQLPNQRLQLLLAMGVVAKAASPQFNQRMQVLMGLMVDQLTHSKNMFFLGSALGVCTSYDTTRDAVDKRAMQLLETMFTGDYAKQWQALANKDADLPKLLECYENVVAGGIVPFAGPCIIAMVADNTQRQGQHARIKNGGTYSMLVQTNSKFVAIPHFKHGEEEITSDRVLEMTRKPKIKRKDVALADVIPSEKERVDFMKEHFCAELASVMRKEFALFDKALAAEEAQSQQGAAASANSDTGAEVAQSSTAYSDAWYQNEAKLYRARMAPAQPRHHLAHGVSARVASAR